MKNLIIRIGYILVGGIIGLIAGTKYSSYISVNKVICIAIFIIIGVMLSFTSHTMTETDGQAIFCLILLAVFAYQLACILCYIVAVIVFIKDILSKILRIFL